MEKRTLGWTGAEVSVVGIGTWQLGADWGSIDEGEARSVLKGAVDSGVTFFDTADVYGDGRSERIIGEFLADHPDSGVFVATKMGRRVAQEPENYTRKAMTLWAERSLENLGVDELDLVQLHCPPSEVLHAPSTWRTLQSMVDDGIIGAFGASVETADQAIMAMDHGVASLQIIFNIFRRKPLDQVLPRAADQGVGVIARVPLASGLLSGRYRHDTVFPTNDHRTYNRDGQAFDVGETFSGVPFDVGVDAAREFSQFCEELGPEGASPAQVALRWIIDQPGVTTVIPGARSAEQARANAAAADLPKLSPGMESALSDLYDRRIRQHVHGRW